MKRGLQIAGQLLAYGLFAVTIGYFATRPPYTNLAPGLAIIKLSISHSGQLREPCRERSTEELAQLAPNMRLPLDCPRERSPVTVELAQNGEVLLHRVLAPGGLHRDGTSTVYASFEVPAGTRRITARLADSVREPGFGYEKTLDLDLKPAEVVVIGFDAKQGGFLLK